MAENSEIKDNTQQDEYSDEEPDMHVCGKCKSPFTELSQYVIHKQLKTCRQKNSSSVSLKESSVCEKPSRRTMLKPTKLEESFPNENGTSSAVPGVPAGKKDTSSFMFVQESFSSRTNIQLENVLSEGQDSNVKQIDGGQESNHQEQMIQSATSDNVEDVVDNDDDEPESVSGENPTVVILDDNKIESSEIEVKILDDNSQSPKPEEPGVEVNHDHGYSHSTVSTSTGENSLTPKKRKRKNSTPKTTRKRKVSNSIEKPTTKTSVVESQSQSQGEQDSILVHIPESQLVHISTTRNSNATSSVSSAKCKHVPATSVFVPIYINTPAKNYRCHKCNVAFKSAEERQVHNKLHKPLFRCNDCTKRFFTHDGLQVHQNTDSHHYACDQCEKVLPSTAKLARHKVVHVTDKKFVCDICEKCYRTEQNLRSHKYTVHAAEKKHKCSYCGKAFARKDKLTRHEYIHTPNRPNFVCPFRAHTGCTRTFYREDKLKRHLFTHSKEKPYKCEQCGRGFARRDNLRDHMRTHTGVYSHMCDLCNKGFLAPNKLKKHLQTLHGYSISDGKPLSTAMGSKPTQALTKTQKQTQGKPELKTPESTEKAEAPTQSIETSATVRKEQMPLAGEAEVDVDILVEDRGPVELTGDENFNSSSGSTSESEGEQSPDDFSAHAGLSWEPVRPVTASQNSPLPALNSSLPLPPPLLPSSRFQGRQTPELLAIPSELLSIVQGIESSRV